MDPMILAQDAISDLQTAGSALWSIVQANGLPAVIGAALWHLWLRRSNRIKAKGTR